MQRAQTLFSTFAHFPVSPSFVCPSPLTTPLSPGLFLTLRYYTTVLEDGTPALTHVHGYLASELDHLVQVGAGAVVVVFLSGLLMAVKARLSRADGLLPLAELAFNQFHTLPGLARWVARKMALVTYLQYYAHGRKTNPLSYLL